MPNKIAEAKQAESPALTKYELHSLYGGRVQVKFYPISHQYWVSVDGSPFVRKTGVTTIIGIMDKSKPLQSWQQGLTLDFLLQLIADGVKIDGDKAIEAVIQHEIAKEQAADIGKEIHSYIEHHIRRKLKQKGFEEMPEMPNFKEAITGVNSFFDWEKEHKVQYLSTETIVYSLKHDFIGIEDITFMADGILCDSDFKSSNGLYNGVRQQTAAYATARMEEGGKKMQGRWAIRLSKYSEEEYMKRELRKKEIRAMINKLQGKEVKDYPIKPYQVFEAKFLDDKKTHFKRDFDAFLHAKALHAWDKETNPFYNGDNW